MTFSEPAALSYRRRIIMNPLYIFRHIECEGPGYLGEVLSRLEIPRRQIAIDRNEPIPASFT